MFLALLATVSLTVSVFASENPCDDDGLSGPTELFKSVCNNLFCGDEDYRAISKDGLDVTDAFLGEYANEYISRNYLSIWNAVQDEMDVIKWDSKNDMVSSRIIMNGRASESFYVLDKTTTHMAGETFEMVYTISGTYRYYDSTGQISDYDNAVVNIDLFNAGALFTYRPKKVSTSTIVASDHRSIKFSATFSIVLCYNSLHIPGLTWWEESFGPYTKSVTGYSY